jgi:predicted nucleotidyltransferase
MARRGRGRADLSRTGEGLRGTILTSTTHEASQGVLKLPNTDIHPKTAARVAEWSAQPEVVGVVLVGSRSRGHSDKLSDDDLEVYLTDEGFSRLAPTECLEVLVEGEGPERKLIYDTQYTSLTDLRRKALSPHDLDRWPYERAPILFDRDGSITEAVEAAGRMDPDFRHKRLLYGTIDSWVAPYRAAKALKRDQQAAARILVARGAKALSRVIFALEWRWVPLDHWLEAELRTLEDPDGAAPDLVRALVDTDPDALTSALTKLEDRLASEGVPRPAGRRDLFFELIHPSRAEEFAIFGLH